MILVITDQEPRFDEAHALSDHTARSLVEAFHWTWVIPYRAPGIVNTDNAPEFPSALWAQHLRMIGFEYFEYRPSSICNPQGDVAETAVKKVKRHASLIRSSQMVTDVPHPSLSMILMNAGRAHNATWTPTAHGRPEEILFGRPRRAVDDHLLGPRPSAGRSSLVSHRVLSPS